MSIILINLIIRLIFYNFVDQMIETILFVCFSFFETGFFCVTIMIVLELLS